MRTQRNISYLTWSKSSASKKSLPWNKGCVTAFGRGLSVPCWRNRCCFSSLRRSAGMHVSRRGLPSICKVNYVPIHAGLKRAIGEVLSEAVWQRCYVHFLRNALDYLPRKADDDCLQELRWLYDRRDVAEAQRDLAGWLAKWQGKYPKLADWVEDNLAETLTFYRLPRQHHKHMKSTNMLERLNEEIKRRTRVVRIFPNANACLRLVRALCAETHETWLEDSRYLNMDLLREQRKEQLRKAA